MIISKKSKIIVSLISIFLTVSGLILFLVNGRLSKNNVDKVVVSESSSMTIPLLTDIEFEDPAISLNFESTSLYETDDCDHLAGPNPKMKLVSYRFGSADANSAFAVVSLNMDEYRNQDDTLESGYNFIDKVMDTEYQLADFRDNAEISSIFGIDCSDEGVLPVVYMEKVNYPDTENAFAFILFGSHTSIVNAASPIVQVVVIARVNDNYIKLSRYPEYNQRIDFLADSEVLKSCEVESDYGYEYLPIFEAEGIECVRNAYLTNIDKSTFDAFVDDMVYKFRLN